MTILLKRVYDPRSASDGYRVLVDRLWPRGMTKERAEVDLWLKEIAPTTGLRKWYAHDVAKWPEFRKRYRVELAGHADLLAEIRALEKAHKTVTLLFGARDAEHNDGNVIVEVLGAGTSG